MIKEKISEAIEKDPRILHNITLTKKSEFIDKNWCRPSSLGKCLRALGYKALGYKEEPMKARGLLTFRFGDLIEDLYAGVAEGLGLIKDRQKVVLCKLAGLPVSGSIDSVSSDGTIIIDFKSTTDIGFGMIERAGEDGIDIGYLVQQNIYMHAMGLKQAILFYVNKNAAHMHEVIINYNPSIIELVESKINKIKECLITKQLPARTYPPTDKGLLLWHCGYCNFRDYCYKTDMTINKKGKPEYKVLEVL